MNQDQNNLNQNKFNTQGNSDISNNQSLNISKKKKEYGTIIGIISIVIVIVIAILLLLNINLKKNQNNNTSSNFITSKYPDYNFTDVKVYDKSTNGSIIYGKKEWIEYEENDELIVTDQCGIDKNILYRFTISNGVLTVTDNNSQSYTFKSITNVKSIMKFSHGQDCYDLSIIILTNDGKIYFRKNYSYLPKDQSFISIDYSTLESQFKLFNSKYKIEKIGYSSYDNTFSNRLGALTSTGNQINIDIYQEVESDIYDNTLAVFVNVYPNGTIQVRNDGTIKWDDGTNNYILNEKNEKIYINYIFRVEYELYIIDRQGYLYNLPANGASTNAKKYSDKRVLKMGIKGTEEHNRQGIILFEDNNYIDINIIEAFGI